MPALRTLAAAVALGLLFAPSPSRGAVHADSTVSVTWDGTYQTDLTGVPGAPDIDWSKAYIPYAVLRFSASTACSEFDAADINVWNPQYEGGMTYYVANKLDHSTTTTAENASISWDQYVHAGAAYLFSGYSHCDGAQPLTWDSDMYYSEVVQVPPVVARVTLKSPKTLRYFNKLKAGETFTLRVEEYTPRDFSSAMFDPKVTAIVEGAGFAKKEFDITDRTKTELADIKPTQKGTLSVKLRVQNYLYYRDDWHNLNDDWGGYSWPDKVPDPDYATTLLSTDRTCDYVANDVKCPNYGKPIHRAVPYTIESAALEIPVEETWCLIQDRADSSKHRVAGESCLSCDYNPNANWWDDACAAPDPETPGLGGLSCSVAGPGLALSWLLSALVPALRRRRTP